MNPTRIKITGYIDVNDLDPALVDLEATGCLTDKGWDEYVNGDPGPALDLSLLEDVELELEP